MIQSFEEEKRKDTTLLTRYAAHHGTAGDEKYHLPGKPRRLLGSHDMLVAASSVSRRAHLATECALTEQTRALDDARTRAIGEGAMRAGAAEDACARQRRMLRDLAVASEGLARDNAALSAELDACRARLERSCEDNRALHDKVRSAQRLYLAGQRDAEARVEEDDLRGGWARKMDALCANEALSESRPPASFTGVRNARSLSVTGGSTPPATTSRSDNPNSTNRHVAGDLFQERQKLRHEVSRLTRRLRDAANRASNAEEELRRVKEIAAERRMADARRRVQGEGVRGVSGKRKSVEHGKIRRQAYCCFSLFVEQHLGPEGDAPGDEVQAAQRCGDVGVGF